MYYILIDKIHSTMRVQPKETDNYNGHFSIDKEAARKVMYVEFSCMANFGMKRLGVGI